MLCAFPRTKAMVLLPVQCTKDRPREYATNSCYGVHLDLKSSHDWCALRTYSRFPEPPAKSLPSGHHDLGSMVSGTPNSKCGGVEIRTETTTMTISLKPPLPSHTKLHPDRSLRPPKPLQPGRQLLSQRTCRSKFTLESAEDQPIPSHQDRCWVCFQVTNWWTEYWGPWNLAKAQGLEHYDVPIHKHHNTWRNYQYMICVESWNKPQPTVLAWDMGMERRNHWFLQAPTILGKHPTMFPFDLAAFSSTSLP